MKRVFGCLLMLLGSSSAYAELTNDSPSTQVLPKKEVPVMIEAMHAEVEDQSTVVTIKLNRKPNFENVTLEDHGTFMQLILTDTVIPKPGEFVDVTTPYITKLVGFQTHPDTTSVRLFVAKDANMVKQASKADLLDSQIIVTLDHKKLEALLKVDPSVTARANDMPTAQEIIAKTDIDTAIPEPASVLKSIEETSEKSTSKEATSIPFKDSEGLNSRLMSATIFCAIMLIGLLAVYIFKPRLRKLRSIPDDYSTYVMKTLATHKVSPKQRLELIDVGGEKVLIAIGPDQVNFLTTIGATSTPKAMQQTANMIAGTTLQNVQPKTLGQATRPNPLQKNRPNPIQHSSTTTATPPTRRIVTPQRPVPRPSAQVTTGKARQIETRVGDDIKMDYRKETLAKENSNHTISDVTKMIREKLKNLPSI